MRTGPEPFGCRRREDGARTGIQLVTIEPGSALAALGLQPNDVVRRINAVDLAREDPWDALAEELRHAARVEVLVHREGRDTVLVWRVE